MKHQWNIYLIYLSIFLCGFVKPLNSQEINLVTRKLVRDVQHLGPFRIGEKSFFVIKDIARMENHDEMTVESFKIIDEKDDVHFQQSYDIQICDYGFQNSYDIDPFIVESSSEKILVIDYYILPSAPLSGHLRQFFILKNGKITPLTVPLTVYGEFGELLKGDSEKIYKLQQDDIMTLKDWTGYFFVTIPVQLNFNAEINSERISFKTVAHIDEKTGLAKLETTVNPVPIEEEHEITLFSTPTAEFGDRIIVTPESVIEFGPAYAEVDIRKNEQNIFIFSNVLRLEIIINGERGFVEENDFHYLGLLAAG